MTLPLSSGTRFSKAARPVCALMRGLGRLEQEHRVPHLGSEAECDPRRVVGQLDLLPELQGVSEQGDSQVDELVGGRQGSLLPDCADVFIAAPLFLGLGL